MCQPEVYWLSKQRILLFCGWQNLNIKRIVCKRYPNNSPPGQFPPDNSPPIFKQLALFIHHRAKQDVKCMELRLNAIEIILRSLIHYQTNNSSFFYPLPSLKFGGELSYILVNSEYRYTLKYFSFPSIDSRPGQHICNRTTESMLVHSCLRD